MIVIFGARNEINIKKKKLHKGSFHLNHESKKSEKGKKINKTRRKTKKPFNYERIDANAKKQSVIQSI